MTLQQQLKPLLQQFSNSVGRGNLIAANSTLVAMIQQMAKAIDAPCASCNCGPPASFQTPLIVTVNPPTITEEAPPVEAVVEKRGRGRPKKVR